MIKLNIASLRQGMYLAKDIFNYEGKLLIDKGKIVKDSYIEKLQNFSINEVYIQLDSNLEYIDVINSDTKGKAIRLMQEIMNSIGVVNQNQMAEIKAIVNDIIHKLLNNENILIYMTELRSIDDYTFHHCVNVCVYSIMIGVIRKYSTLELEELGLGAILHDIGKSTIPHSILNKPSSLNDLEFQEIKQHTTRGYEIAKMISGIPENSRLIVRDHHERFDGTGYPNGIKGKEIHEYARVVSICDVYDALTSNRIYKRKTTPHYAIDYLIGMSNHQFDYDIIKSFIYHVEIYPLGTMVKLQSGEIGRVVRKNRFLPTKPIVELIEITEGESHQNRIDLKKHLNNQIIEVLI